MDSIEIVPCSPPSPPKHLAVPTSTPCVGRKEISLNFDESVIQSEDPYSKTLNRTVVPSYNSKPNGAVHRKPMVIYSSEDEDTDKNDDDDDSSSSNEVTKKFQTGNSSSVGIIVGTPSTNSVDDIKFVTAEYDTTVPFRGPVTKPSSIPKKATEENLKNPSTSNNSDSSSSCSSPNSVNFIHRRGKSEEEKKQKVTNIGNTFDQPKKKFEFKNKVMNSVQAIPSSSSVVQKNQVIQFGDGAVGGNEEEETIPIDDLCNQVDSLNIEQKNHRLKSGGGGVEQVGNLLSKVHLDKNHHHHDYHHQQQRRQRSRSSSPEIIGEFESRRVPPPIIPPHTLKSKEQKQKQMIYLPAPPSHTPDLPPELMASVGKGIQNLQKIISEIPTDDKEDPLGHPDRLIAELYEHQVYGLKWLWWREHQFPFGGILADEMGLGKTVMVLALVCRGKSEGTKENNAPSSWISSSKSRLTPSRATMVVCPPSVMGQWEDEIKKKTNNLRVLLYHGPTRPKSPAIVSQYDIVLTSYNTLGSDIPKLTEQSEEACRSPLLKVFWERIVLDEGHIIRNPKTAGAQAACRLNAKHRWVVTGTPVHNSPLDMFSLVKFLQLKPFNDKQVWETWIGMKCVAKQNAERLNIIGRSLLLRRTKDEVMCGLKGQGQSIPEKTIVDIKVELKPEEREIYDHLATFAEKEFRDFLKNQERRQEEKQAAAYNYIAGRKKVTSSQEKNYSHIFVLILRLRQCSVLPHLIRTMIDDDEDIDNSNEYDPVEDLISLKNPTFDEDFKSAKLERLYEDLEDLRERSHKQGIRMDKAIIVSQWTSLLKVVEMHLKQKKFSCVTISGQVKIADRMDIMSKFNGNPKGPEIMLLSLQAGGVGLNLTGANHLFFLDIHWNPQLELQAQDRIHRFGQKKPVTIYRYISTNTMEERVMELQDTKMALANGILHSAGKKTGTGGLNMAELQKLFGINV